MLDSSTRREKASIGAIKPSFWNRAFPVNPDIAIWTLAIIWGSHFLFMAVRSVLLDFPSSAAFVSQYLLVVVFCAILTWLIYHLLLIINRHGISHPVLLLIAPVFVFAICAAYLEAVIVDASEGSSVAMNWPRFFDKIFIFFLLMGTWGGSYLALARDRTTKLAIEHSHELEKLTRDSQLRALRFQLNPHFVFNALNSVSSLIIEQKNTQAERLVDGLADYMRAVLSDDGENMVTVEQEIAQQVRYLEIEQVRFPKRLSFEVSIDDDVREWKIPALIVQPLIENAIKYGVARSTIPVEIQIHATKKDDRLRLRIVNNGRMIDGVREDSGTGTGLANIRERLSALYGATAALVTANSDGMATASLIIPDETLVFRKP